MEALTNRLQAALQDVPVLLATPPPPLGRPPPLVAMTRLRRPLRLAAGFACGLGVAAAAVAVTASATGLRIQPDVHAPLAMGSPPVTIPAVEPTPFSIIPKPQTPPPPMRSVAGPVLFQSEAQALGIPTRQLTMDLKQGTTLGQVVTAKGLTAVQFGALVAKLAQPQFDQQVAGGQMTATAEQTLLKQLQTGQVPNWSTTTKAV